jgi:hypothetical protein
MPAAKPIQLKHRLTFDEAMRRLVKLPPPPSGKKAKRIKKKKNEN